MIKETYDAVFKDGVFRPVKPQHVAIPEGQKVRLTVEVVEPFNEMLELAGEVYAGLSEEQINEIEQLYGRSYACINPET